MQHRETRRFINNSFVQLERQTTDQPQQQCTIINISRGGLCFQSTDAYELNEIVNLRIIVDKHPVHTAHGRVCYRKNLPKAHTTNYGLSFLDKFIDTDLIRGKTGIHT